ncbi:unnamed protein product, partial [Protopolystoma xenopodis]
SKADTQEPRANGAFRASGNSACEPGSKAPQSMHQQHRMPQWTVS